MELNQSLNSAVKSLVKSDQNAEHLNIQEINEPIYCICQKVSYGKMVMCDNSACEIGWFHFRCVHLYGKPKGEWYCPNCRGENHKKMNETIQINYNNTQSSTFFKNTTFETARKKKFSTFVSFTYTTRSKCTITESTFSGITKKQKYN